MELTRRATVIATAVVTAALISVVFAAIWIVGEDPPTPSVAPAASAEEGDAVEHEVMADDAMGSSWFGGPGMGGPAWEAHRERCEPVMSVIYGPTPEDIEASKAENAAIIEVLEAAGIEYRVVSAEDGWEHVEPVDEDGWEAFEQALQSYYEQQTGPPEHELERIREENQKMVAFFEERGIDYEVITEPDGWEHVEPTGEDGWDAMDEFWQQQERDNLLERAEAAGIDPQEALDCQAEERRLQELSDQLHMFPYPMDTSMAEQQAEMVADLRAAFDEAGIDYDQVDVPILEWDVTADGAADIVRRIADEYGYGWDMADDTMMEEVVIMGDTEPEPEPAG